MLGQHKPTATELAQGDVESRSLLEHLPDLRGIVLGGQKAQDGWDAHLVFVIGDRYRVLRTVHPSGQSFAQDGAKARFLTTLAKTAKLER